LLGFYIKYNYRKGDGFVKLLCCICGMEINNKNMNVNSAAFMGANNEETIEFCPFCGAIKQYLVEECDNLEFYKKEELDSRTLQILDHAIKLELFNSDFYRKAAVLAEDIRIKDMFRDLAHIEYIHANIHLRLGGFTEVPKLADISYDRYDNDTTLVEQAKLRERHAVDYYRKYMNSVCSEYVRRILRVLEAVEKDHITLLSG
jgi:rubrerythrin